ncbi:MAG: hypothetical protein ACJAZS_000524 [Alteromonas naphthalenivorans]|jgi:hypothetical protein
MYKNIILFPIVLLCVFSSLVSNPNLEDDKTTKRRLSSFNHTQLNTESEKVMSDTEKLENLKKSDSDASKERKQVPEKYGIERTIRHFSQLPVPPKSNGKADIAGEIESAHERKFFFAALVLLEHMAKNGTSALDTLDQLGDIVQQDPQSLHYHAEKILEAYISALWEAHRTPGVNEPSGDVIRILIEQVAYPIKEDLKNISRGRGYFSFLGF